MYCNQCGYNNPVAAKFCKNCDLELRAGQFDAVRTTRPAELIYAGFWVRFLAAFLDILVLGTGVILLVFLIAGVIAFNGRDNILHDRQAVLFFYGIIIFISVAYSILMESGMQGATLGKRWMNIKVLDAKGNRLTVSRALARFIARQFSRLLLLGGYLIQPVTRRKQTLHDMLAGTVVVRENDSKKISIMATMMVLFFAVIIPVLALFSTAGLPVYQQHILKVQRDKGMEIGREATLAVARFYRINGRVPSDIGDTAGHISQSPHVAGIVINQQNGEISVVFSGTVRSAIRNRHLIFSPTLETDLSISWKCHSNNIESRILPDSCR